MTPRVYETSPLPQEPRTLAERLKWLRKHRGLTQVELSSELGCEQAVVSSWEVGRTRPSATSLNAVARFFQVSLKALETGEGFLRETKRRSARAGADDTPVSTNHSINLPPNADGALMVLDRGTGSQDEVDTADGLALLLRALGKGRKAWIVIE